MTGFYTFRQKDDTSNPVAPRVYWLGTTNGRLVFYLQNAVGNRTAFASILCEGARFTGDTVCRGAVRVMYAGFDLPEFDAAGNRNWRLVRGFVPVPPVYKTCTMVAATNRVLSAAHGYANGNEVAFHARGGTLAAPIIRHAKYVVAGADAAGFTLEYTTGGAVDLTADSVGLVQVYRANAGLYDPNQSRLEFFPALNYSFAGLCAIELLLPADLSDGDSEPTRLQVVLDGKMVYDYVLDVAGVLQQTGAPVAGENNALVSLDILRHDGNLPLTRFEGESWLDWRDRCDATIPWLGGNSTPAKPASFGVLTNFAYDLDADTLTNTGGIARAVTHQLPAGNALLEAVYLGGDASLVFTSDNAGTLNLHGITANAGVLYCLTAAGATIIGESAISDRLKIEYRDGEFYAYRNGVPVNLADANPPPAPATPFYGMFYSNGGAGWRGVQVAPSGDDTTPLQIPRFRGGLTLLAKTPVVDCFESEVAMSAGASWQDVDGEIVILPEPDRQTGKTLFTFDLSNTSRINVEDGDVAAAYNYLKLSCRDSLDPLLTRRYAFANRPLHRLEFGHNESDLIQYGVMPLSQLERIGETQMRLDTDLPFGFSVEAFLDSLEVAKGDFCLLVAPETGYTAENPALCMVQRETTAHGSEVERRNYKLRIITTDFYSDTAHGAVKPNTHQHITAAFVAPPPVEALTVQESARRLRDGTYISTILGEVTFAPTPNQRGRVWLKSLQGDGAPVVPNHAADTLTGSATLLGTLVDQLVSVAAVDIAGALPAGLLFDRAYVLRFGGGSYSLEDAETAAPAAFTSNGTGTIKLFPFVDWRLTDLLLQPDPDTRQRVFEVPTVEHGWHYVRVVAESAAGVRQPFATGKTAALEVTGDLTEPAAPTNLRYKYDGVQLRWEWSASTSQNTAGYHITDDAGNVINEFTATLTFGETARASTVARRVYAVSRSGVRSTAYAALTFVLPPQPIFVNITNGDYNTANQLTKTAGAFAGATANYGFALADVARATYTANAANKQRRFGLAQTKNFAAPADIANGFLLDSDGNAYVIEAGVPVHTIGAYAAGDKFRVQVAATGAVTYYRAPVATGVFGLVHTAAAANTNFLLWLGVLLSTTGDVLNNDFELEGVLLAIDGFAPHYNNFTRMALDVVTGELTGAGTSAWDTSGASSLESLAENQDGLITFGFGQTNKLVGVGFNTADVDRHINSIPLSVYAKDDATFEVRNNTSTLATGAYSAATSFAVLRLNNLAYVLKDNALIYPLAGTHPLVGQLIIDMSFYSTGTVQFLKMTRRVGTGATKATMLPAARIGDTSVVSVQQRVVQSTTIGAIYRGGDTTPPVITGLVLTVPFERTFVDGTGDVEVQLRVAVPNNNYLNFNSVGGVYVRVWDKFKNLLATFDRISFPTGGGLLAKLPYAGKYANPKLEAIFGLRFENAYGTSREIYVKAGTTSEAEFAAQVVRDSPLELTLESGQDALKATWQNPVDNNSAKVLEWRKLGELTFANTLAIATAGDTTATATAGVYLNNWYEARIKNNTTGLYSNIALVYVVAKPSAATPPVEGITAALAGANTAVSWTPPAGATGITGYKVYRDGTEVADQVGTTFGEAIAEGATFVYTVKVKYGGTLSPASSPASVTRPVTPPATAPSDLQAISLSATRGDFTWLLNGNTGAVQFSYYGNNGVTTHTGDVPLAAGTTSHTLFAMLPDTDYVASVTAGGIGGADWSGHTPPSYGGGGGYCFLHWFRVVLASGGTLSFSALWRNREHVIGLPVKSFDDDGNVVVDYIEQVFKETATEYLEVLFAGDEFPFLVTPRHRFFNQLLHFVQIGKMQVGDTVKQLAAPDRWETAKLESATLVQVPAGVEVFNIHTRLYQHYFVQTHRTARTAKAVHNYKPPEE